VSTPDTQVSVAQWIARGLAIVVLVPIRLLWEGIRLLGRVTGAALVYVARHLLVPLAELIWHWMLRPAWIFAKDFLWGWVLQHLLWGLVLTPLASSCWITCCGRCGELWRSSCGAGCFAQLGLGCCGGWCPRSSTPSPGCAATPSNG
jgi:hypothetical protein